MSKVSILYDSRAKMPLKTAHLTSHGSLALLLT